MKTLIFLLPVVSGFFFYDYVLATEKIDVNAAPLEDLVQIIHIGEARALELISLRPFSSLDDLARIKGISQKRVGDIKKQGLAWAQAIPTPSVSAQTERMKTENPSSLAVLLMAPTLAIISGAAILLLKRGTRDKIY